MLFVDHEGMGMGRLYVVNRTYALGEVRVVHLQVVMSVRQIGRVMNRPDHPAQHRPGSAQTGEHQKGGAGIRLGGDQASDGIGDKPADVRQGELSRKQGWPIRA